MRHLPKYASHLRIVTALIFLLAVAGCGGGGGGEVVVVSPPPVAALAITLTRVGPNAVQIDWSNDPFVASFTVSRDGYNIATVGSLTLIDASVWINQSYCYQVSGYDSSGLLVAATGTACLTIFP